MLVGLHLQALFHFVDLPKLLRSDRTCDCVSQDQGMEVDDIGTPLGLCLLPPSMQEAFLQLGPRWASASRTSSHIRSHGFGPRVLANTSVRQIPYQISPVWIQCTTVVGLLHTNSSTRCTISCRIIATVTVRSRVEPSYHDGREDNLWQKGKLK